MNDVVDITLDTIIAKLREIAPAIRALGRDQARRFRIAARAELQAR